MVIRDENGRTAIERMRDRSRITCIVTIAISLVMIVIAFGSAFLSSSSTIAGMSLAAPDAMRVNLDAYGGKIFGIGIPELLMTILLAVAGVSGLIWMLSAIANAAVKSMPGYGDGQDAPEQTYQQQAYQQPPYQGYGQPQQPQR
jgi:hypothetical protein